ncbi:MAG: ABC transporter permease [Phycisphaeraceae bacterium]|nr:ABC transporter permease [Phycisphaeraceae bacterium]|tara:strand:- start:144 stop:971 length:828 start_codon:yes stop_codon:yes gene_type:complete
MVLTRIANLGNLLMDQIAGFGRFAQFSMSAFKWLFRGVGRWGRLSLLSPQLFSIGTRSIPVIMLLGLFIGMVLAIETFEQFDAFGIADSLGAIINISVVKQIGPVLAAVMLAGRVGGAVSAELGTMHVTEQLDALRVMGADPVAYLVVPRVIACVVMIPVMTVFSDIMGIFGGYLVTVQGFGVNAPSYWQRSADFVGSWDLSVGLLKSICFGLAIGLISCYKGFHCKGGAAGVGKAATDSFVSSFIAIIIINFFMAKFLRDMYPILFGHEFISAF